jgi:hypothetical protein
MTTFSDNDDSNLAVVAHLIRMIQDSPDVRYYVGGPHTRMRELLVEAITANGYPGNPLDVLKPAAHRADVARVKKLEDDVARLENGIEALHAILRFGDEPQALAIVETLQRGESVP